MTKTKTPVTGPDNDLKDQASVAPAKVAKTEKPAEKKELTDEEAHAEMMKVVREKQRTL